MEIEHAVENHPEIQVLTVILHSGRRHRNSELAHAEMNGLELNVETCYQREISDLGMALSDGGGSRSTVEISQSIRRRRVRVRRLLPTQTQTHTQRNKRYSKLSFVTCLQDIVIITD